MEIAKAIPEDIPSLCKFLELLFSQESEFKPDMTLQSAGLQQIIDYPERGQILVLRQADSIVGMVSVLFSISTALNFWLHYFHHFSSD